MKAMGRQVESLPMLQKSSLHQGCPPHEHIPLNKYLFDIKRADTNKCMACQRETTESVRHFLFECPTYNHERHRLNVQLGQNSRNLKTIFANPKHVKELLIYVGCTEWLKPVLGDVAKEKQPTMRQKLADMGLIPKC